MAWPRCLSFLGVRTPLGTPGLRIRMADPQLDSAHLYASKMVKRLLWHVHRQVHEAVIVADVDASYMAAVEARFVGDGT